jgi:hypothetical protein
MKHLIGLAAFAAAIAIGVGMTRYFRPAPPPAPKAVEPAPPPAPLPPLPPAAPQTAQASPLGAEIRNIVLDRRQRASMASVRLIADSRSKPPAKAWVWISFTVPGARQVFTADPVEVKWPAGGSPLALVEVRTPAPWCGTPGDPGSGYVAHIRASAVSAKDAVSGAESGDGIPVLVVEDQKTPR